MLPAPSSNLKFPDKSGLYILFFVLIGFVAYSNTLQVPFLFDDEGSIQLNNGVHGISNFMNGGYRYLPNRVFGYLTFAINYQLSGLNVASYHIVNLTVHILTTFLLYRFVQLTFMTPFLRETLTRSQINVYAFLVAALFISHPVQTQAVTYIVQRLTSLSSMLYLASLVCYIQWRLTDNSSASKSWIIRNGWFIASLMCTILAMKTKEIAFTLPVVITLYEFFFFGRPDRRLLVHISPLLLTILVIPSTLIGTFGALNLKSGILLSDVNSPVYNVTKINRLEYIYTQFSVILTYLRLLLFPVHQNLDYDYPLNHSIFEPRTFLSFSLILIIFAVAIFMFRLSSRMITKDGRKLALLDSALLRLASYGIVWFFITLSVESSVITIQDVIFEHRLYLPSCGFFISIVAFGYLALKQAYNANPLTQFTTKFFVAIIILSLSTATYMRNGIWNNWISIWSDTVSKSPAKPRAHLILGIGYYNQGDLKEALQEYQEVTRLKPDYVEAYSNSGLALAKLNRHEEAIAMFQKFLQISAFDADTFASIYNEIGLSYDDINELNNALKAFATAVKLNEESVKFRNNYAYALQSLGDIDAALKEYRTVLNIDPTNKYASTMIMDILKNRK